jgi:hypothetical protein
MVKFTDYDLGLINLSILTIILIEAMILRLIFRIFTSKYFFLLLFNSVFSILTVIELLCIFDYIKIKHIYHHLFAAITWIFYTQSYLFFLTSYYQDLLQNWQFKTCYTINFVNFIAQIWFSVLKCFDLKLSPRSLQLQTEISSNISATLTILSETFLTFYIFKLILKISKTTMNAQVKIMLIKVLITMTLMWSLDFIIIFLEYSGRETKSYISKPMILNFKFFIELLILGYCKKQLVIYSGMDRW